MNQSNYFELTRPIGMVAMLNQPPAALLDAVEDAWLMLKESVPQPLMPKVLAGEDEFVSFCWAASGKRLEISFRDFAAA